MPVSPPAAIEIHAQTATDQLATVDPSQPITNLRHGVLLCDQLSRSDLVPRGLQGKPANVFIVIMAGQEMGLTWPVSLRTIYSPGPGQIGMRGELLLAKLHEHGHEYDWEEVPGQSCTFRLERYGADPNRKTRPYEATFTIDDAIQAGLAKRNADGDIVALSRENKPLPWMQYSSDMLFWRAVARCVKRGAPEVLMGFEVQGADDRVDSTPGEVELKPASQVPAGPESGRATEEQLRILDERMREAEAPHFTQEAVDAAVDWAGEQQASQQQVTTGDVVSDPPDLPEPEPEPGVAEDPTAASPGTTTPESAAGAQDEGAAGKAKGQILSERFAALGWHPSKHRSDLMRASSMFLRRRVSGSRDMSTAEIMNLATELTRIQRSYPEAQHPVALADKVELWREQWAEADPEGYREYAGE